MQNAFDSRGFSHLPSSGTKVRPPLSRGPGRTRLYRPRLGAPDWIRTSGLPGRSRTLYPTELRTQIPTWGEPPPKVLTHYTVLSVVWQGLFQKNFYKNSGSPGPAENTTLRPPPPAPDSKALQGRQVIGGALVDAVEPVDIQEVGVAPPAKDRLPGRVVLGVVPRRRGDGQSPGQIPVVLPG